ncbi:MAG: hypothetical protein K8I27_08245 [Planctomycetes bacterium]|nr:hypothetical protein [Planctomycetota bacterium]
MTKRLFTLLLLLLLAAPLCAQDSQPADEPEPTEEEVVGIPVDYNKYLKTLYPNTDPGSKHDVFNLKNPTGKNERHEYTSAMAQLVLAYVSSELDFGSTLSKLFDQYSRGTQANSPIFKVLYSIVLLYYPPGNPNAAEAQKLLREAAELAPDFAYPHLLLAQVEYSRLMQIEGVSPRATLQALDKALEIRPDFLRAILLKCEVYLQYQPPRTKEVLEMIKPWTNQKLPELGFDFEDVLKVYARSSSNADVQTLIEQLLAGGKLTQVQKLSAHQVAGTKYLSDELYDDAIVHFEKMHDLVTVEDNPQMALRARKSLAACWDFKARALKKGLDDPETKTRYNQFINKAADLHRACAELEARHIPLVMRGQQAFEYVQFVSFGLGDDEAASKWLGEYLANTDLTRSHRNLLENVKAGIDLKLNPTEEGLITSYRNHLKRGDLERLAISLGMAKEKLRLDGTSFTEEASLRFFLEALTTGDRMVTRYAAFLVATTAKELGGEFIAMAGDALIARLLQEDELKSEAQADLHADLAQALKILESWTHMEQAVRHSAKMVKLAKDELTVRELTQPIIDNWNDEALLKKLNPPLKRPGRMDIYSAGDAAEWLAKKLAESVKKTAEAESAPPGDDE